MTKQPAKYLFTGLGNVLLSPAKCVLSFSFSNTLLIFFWINVLVAPGYLLGQGQSRQAFVDSLTQNIPTTKDSLYHVHVATIGEKHADLDTSYYYIMESMAVAKALKNNTSIWNSYMLLGKWHFRQGLKSKALPFFDTAYTVALDENNAEWQSRTLIIKADSESTIGDGAAAQKSYSKALDICGENNFVRLGAILQLRIGEFHRTHNASQKALPHYAEAERLFDSLNMQQGICLCKYGRGGILQETANEDKDYLSIIKLFSYAAGEKCQPVLQGGMLAASHAVLGENYGLMGDHAKAEFHLKKGLKLARADRNVAVLAFTLGNLAMHYGQINNREKALEAIEEAEAIAQEVDELEIRSTTQEQKATMYRHLGEIEKAMNTMEGFVEMEIERIKEQNLLATEELNIKYNTLQKEQELTQQKLMLASQESKFNKLLLLGGLLGVALFGLLIWYSIRLRNKRLDTKRLEEVNRIKTEFFTNISHEFRTPLTLILAPLRKYFYQEQNTASSTIQFPKSEVASMIRNTGQLQELIDQLLDLSHLESKQLSLHTTAIDLTANIQRIVNNFTPLAQQKGIELNFTTAETNIIGSFDQEKVATIFSNILSNAIKFTPREGSVKVDLIKDREQVKLTISDTGEGISKTHLPHLFERFYQADSSLTRSHGGSGIGLALAKELCELHGGNIQVASEAGKGTIFTIVLPYEAQEQITEPSKSEALISRRDALINDWNAAALFLPKTNEGQEKTAAAPQILIVEDNADMRGFIKQELQEHYQVIEADNGTRAFALAQEHLPDLVLSDVMMPGKGSDGLSLIKALKEEVLTSHIPVILLTAKATTEDQISGLASQADDYIIKPFDPKVLKARVDNLLHQRRKLKILFAESIQILPEDLPVSSQEKVFMEQVMQEIEEHIGDENFGVEQMGNKLNMDRSQLFRKIKALTGNSPSQLLKEMRLQRAKYFLENRAGNVSQVAQSVGYRDPVYFSKAFKKYFGNSPSEILKQAAAK